MVTLRNPQEKEKKTTKIQYNSKSKLKRRNKEKGINCIK